MFRRKYIKTIIRTINCTVKNIILSDFCKTMNTNNPSSFAKEVKYKGKNAKFLPIEFSDEKTYELAIKMKLYNLQ